MQPHRRSNFMQRHSSVSSGSRFNGHPYKYDDDDDYGVPKLKQPPARPVLLWKRYKSPVAVVTGLLILLFLLSRLDGRGSDGGQAIDWSRFAYVQYVTDPASMCNAFMVFESLHRLGSKAERVLLYPEEWEAHNQDPRERTHQLLTRAHRLYGVKLKPVQLLSADGPVSPGTEREPSGWDVSITKLRAFELDEYDRVLHLDSDITLLQHMDELFSLPSAPIAMPRAYWSGGPPGSWPLSSLLMLIEPNPAETKHLFELLQKWRFEPDREVSNFYDMDLLNARFKSSALVLPHRPYALLSAEFRQVDHTEYMGTFNAPPSTLRWDPFRAMKEAKLVHFSDWPLPKPWVMWPVDGLMEMQPTCSGGLTGTCAEREIWKGLYNDFRQRRKEHCGLLSVPAPVSWREWKNKTGAG